MGLNILRCQAGILGAKTETRHVGLFFFLHDARKFLPGVFTSLDEQDFLRMCVYPSKDTAYKKDDITHDIPICSTLFSNNVKFSPSGSLI